MNLPVLYLQARSHHVYQLLSTKTDLSTKADLVGIEMCQLRRLGDETLRECSASRVKSGYDQLTTEEVQMIVAFLANHPNPQQKVLRYHKGELSFVSYLDRGQRRRPPSNFLDEALQTIVGPKDLVGGQILQPEIHDTFANLVVTPEVRQALEQGLAKFRLQDFLYNQWNLKSVDSQARKTIINLYGPPGTGKTKAARAYGQAMSKKILQVDYSQIESKWVGDTGKNLKKLFDHARQNDLILFLDEADTLVSARVNEGGSTQASYLNNTRNIFLQELDRFEGVVLMTTNLFRNYDPALLRRIAHHVKFDLPESAAREVLFKQHLPAAIPQEIDWPQVVKESAGLSGGDIRTCCLEGAVAAAMASETDLAQACLRTEHLLGEIEKIKRSQREHQQQSTRRPLGLGV